MNYALGYSVAELAMSLGVEIAWVGLSNDFQRSMRIAFFVFAAMYLIYPLIIGVVLVLWRRGRKGSAKTVLVATVVLAPGIPALDQWRVAKDNAGLLDSEIWAPTVDLAGRKVLYVDNGCGDLCKALVRNKDVAEVLLVSPRIKELQYFAENGEFPPSTKVVVPSIDGAIVKKTAATHDELAKADILVLRRDFGTSAKKLRAFYPKSVASSEVRISTMIADWSLGTPLDNLEPLVLTIRHVERPFALPLHPSARAKAPEFDWQREQAYLLELFS